MIVRGLELGSSGVLLGDAAMGTALQALGLPVGVPPELWTLSHPDLIQQIHIAHARAGARWLTANTFGANRPRLRACGQQLDAAELSILAVRLASAVSADLPVLGSMGPTGSPDPAEWAAAYREQAEALAGAGASGAMVETIVALPEGLSAVRAARDAGLATIVASYTPGKRGRLLDGTGAEAAASALVQAGAGLVGVNCGSGPRSLLCAVRRLAGAGIAPVYAAPNAGLPVAGTGCLRWPVSPRTFARWADRFAELGVRLIAGCCGTTAEHIAAARAALSAGGSGDA